MLLAERSAARDYLAPAIPLRGLRKTSHRGTALLGWMFTLAAAAYNVVRICKLLDAAA
jgi:hypothetical protein